MQRLAFILNVYVIYLPTADDNNCTRANSITDSEVGHISASTLQRLLCSELLRPRCSVSPNVYIIIIRCSASSVTRLCVCHPENLISPCSGKGDRKKPFRFSYTATKILHIMIMYTYLGVCCNDDDNDIYGRHHNHRLFTLN